MRPSETTSRQRPIEGLAARTRSGRQPDDAEPIGWLPGNPYCGREEAMTRVGRMIERMDRERKMDEI